MKITKRCCKKKLEYRELFNEEKDIKDTLKEVNTGICHRKITERISKKLSQHKKKKNSILLFNTG